MLNNLKVLKRDGLKQTFDKQRLFIVVQKAADAANQKIENLEELVGKILAKFEGKEEVSVDDIQNSVEHTLMVSKYKETAKKYIEYRKSRDIAREMKSQWVKLGVDLLTGEDSESQRENSNIPRDTVTTTVEMINRLYSKKFVLDFILPKKFKESHDKCEIHIHDLHNNLTKVHNCMLLDYPYMLKNGFQLGNKWIETPNTILTAMNVLVQMVQVESNLQYGGLTLGWLDVYLAQYVYGSFKKHFENSLIDIYEELATPDIEIHPESEEIMEKWPKAYRSAIRRTKEETYKACKLLSYQLNTLQIRGESSPFVTIGYGTATDWAGKLIQESILQERIDEFKRSGVQEFPKHLFAARAGVNLNKGDPNYYIFKKAINVAAQTCYPDFIFPENQEFHTGGSAYYMGCRSLLSPWYNEKGEQVYLGRGNAGVVTINLPRIALESNGNIEKFFQTLDERLALSKEVCIWRYNRLISLQAKEAPFTYIGGAFGMTLNPEDTVEKCFADGRGSLSIGYIGLHEVSLLLTGSEPYYSNEALQLQIKVMKYLEDYTDKCKKETGLGFGVYSSPVESTTERFCKADLASFGEIKGVTDKGFYVNSYHVNTETKLTPFEKIDIESQLQPYAKGGHVAFAEMSNAKDNVEAYESIIRYAHDKKMMYFAINSAWDFCKTCHWTGEVKTEEAVGYTYKCPCCEESSPDKLIITRRLCGYITSFNKRPPVAGRIKEIKSRVKHS